MSLYRYAENRAALLDGVSELVLNELEIVPDDPDWQAQLRRIAHCLRELALRHPNVVPLLVTRPLSTPLGLRPLGTLRPLEQILALNPTTEGQTTTLYLADKLKPLGVKVPQIAHGLPAGGNLDYADQATLISALQWRREL